MHRLQDARGDPRATNRLISALNELQAKSACNQSQRAGRFAPTPSGPLHQGSLVAALASRCEALAHSYAWHLRIDDIDPPRIRTGAATSIVETLTACGFDWDGDVLRQSLREKQYQGALAALIKTGRVFRCFCTRRQCGADGRCISTCRDSDLADEHACSLRLCVLEPASENCTDPNVRFVDQICGEQTTDPAQSLGDIVVRRRDGPWSYALACAVDDSDGITDVVRGADLLQATFAQQLIMTYLGRTCPRYAHVPVAQDAQGRKLGKQTSAPPIDAAQALPSLMQAWHFLGQSFIHNPVPSTLQDFWQCAADEWSLPRVPASGTALPG